MMDITPCGFIEAHERGVNWVCFHPTEDLLLTSADDKRIKVWSYSVDKERISEKETFYGHLSNISSVEVHKKLNLVISNSEDKTCKVWDMSGVCLDTYAREGEKHWIVASHPYLPIIATGCDNSMVVLQL
jgi:coatomer subunit alpha